MRVLVGEMGFLSVAHAAAVVALCAVAGCESGPGMLVDQSAGGTQGFGDAGPGMGAGGAMPDGDGSGAVPATGGQVSGDGDGMSDAGTPDGGEDADIPPAPRPPCLTKPSQVVVIGDSYINYNEVLNPDLAARAIADGALQQGEAWRMYAVPGSSMASGGIAGFIPDQFTQAVAADPEIHAVVMTGGGNDILIPNGFILGGGQCKDSATSDQIQVCQDIVQLAIDRAEELMDTAADAGVKDVVYFFYPKLPGGGLGGLNPNVILDYAYPLAQALCEGAEDRTAGELRCHFIDLRPVFDGQNWIQGDGIHPTADGHEAMADEIWDVMKAGCVAQPESSGCCDPG